MMTTTGEQNDSLRDATRENNLTWLGSFGCDIARSTHAIHVEHNQLAEYCAWLVYGDDDILISKLRAHSDSKIPWTEGRIFVDLKAAAPSTRRFLHDGNFDAIGFSTTYAALVEPGEVSSTYDVRAALPEEAERWARMYADGFSGKQEFSRELSRWRESFLSSSAVRFWFLQRLGQEIGVVQTCHAYSVVGLYSLALTESNRSFGNLRGAVNALASHLTRNGSTYVYFELESSKQTPPGLIRRGGVSFNAVSVMSINYWKSES
jgi:hypothetical protein